MDLSEVIDLQLAFRRVQKDQRDDAWPDIVEYKDYNLELDDNLNSLKSLITRPEAYQASQPAPLDIPKTNYTLRPGLALSIEDRIIYQSLADYLAPHFKPETCVYSNHLKGPNQTTMFKPGVQLWLAFQNREEELCQEFSKGGYQVKTDLAAYFDHINPSRMKDYIRDLFKASIDRDVLNSVEILLKRLWDRWSGLRQHGIPQVIDPSSFFGNIYLDELDKRMLRSDYIYFRYVDDIRIFAPDEASARKALANLIGYLREMELYVSAAKTEIRPVESVSDQLIKRRKKINTIETFLDSGLKEMIEMAASELEGFFLETVEDPDLFDGRHFRYCVNRFKRLKVSELSHSMHERVISEILQRLFSMPSSTDIFVDYLSLFPENGYIQAEVCDFLESPYNIYPWQEMLLLELLIRVDVPQNLEYRVRRIAKGIAVATSGSHPACRAKAIVLWGKMGDHVDKREIRSLFDSETHDEVRRAILVSIQEMQNKQRDNFYRKFVPQSLQRTTRYVQSLTQPTYHYYNAPTGYDWEALNEWWGDLSREDFLY